MVPALGPVSRGEADVEGEEVTETAAEWALRMLTARARLVLTAGSDDQEVPDAGNPFAEAVVGGLAGAADLDGDGLILGSEIAQHVRAQVALKTLAAGRPNDPVFALLPEAGKDLQEGLPGDFVFLSPEGRRRRWPATARRCWRRGCRACPRGSSLTAPIARSWCPCPRPTAGRRGWPWRATRRPLRNGTPATANSAAAATCPTSARGAATARPALSAGRTRWNSRPGWTATGARAAQAIACRRWPNGRRPHRARGPIRPSAKTAARWGAFLRQRRSGWPACPPLRWVCMMWRAIFGNGWSIPGLAPVWPRICGRRTAFAQWTVLWPAGPSRPGRRRWRGHGRARPSRAAPIAGRGCRP